MTSPLPGPHTLQTSWHQADSLAKIEAVVVLLAAPFLFFPTLSWIATLLALIGLAVVWLLPPLIRHQPGLPATPFTVSLIPWGLVLIVAIVVSADPSQTLPKATGILLGLATWRLIVNFADNRSTVILASWGFVLLATGLTVIGSLGLTEIAKIPSLAPLSPTRLFSVADTFGLAIHPNQLAGLICLLLPLLVSLLFGWHPSSNRAMLKRTALLILTLLVALILLMTQSRGGWVGVLGGLFVLLVSWAVLMPPSSARKVARWTVAGVITGGMAAAVWIGPARIQQLWLDPPAETAVGTLTTLNYRRELWPWALTAAHDFAITGTGLGTFREVAFRLYPVELSPDADIGHAHNIFLQTALDVGVPGLIVYGSLLLIAIGGAWSVGAADPRYRPFALGLLAGLAALHIYGLADALALGSKPSLLFWYALGLIAVMSMTSDRRRANQAV